MKPHTSAGLFNPAPRPAAAFRLFCFPYAGAGAAIFRLWPRHLPDDIELFAIHAPGRAHRLREAPLTSIPALVEAALAEITPLLDRPFALFGHSLGAVVAAECARALESRGVTPAHLFVSARPPLRRPDPHIHALPDNEFIAALNRRYQGIPAEILQYPEILELLLPALRADLQALETFGPDASRPALRCPTSVFGGSLDRAVSRDDLESWREEALDCRIRVFPGDHFYIDPQRASLVAEIAATLQATVSRREPADAAS